jgi:signal transduction histidine kinase
MVSTLASGGRVEPLVAEWPRIILTRVKLQSASLWRVGPDGDALSLVSYAGGTRPVAQETAGIPALGAMLDAAPDGIDNGEQPGDLGTWLGLRRFMWNTLRLAPDVRYLSAIGFNAATWQFHAPFTAADLSFARIAARMLEAMLGQLQSIDDLVHERERLRELNDELMRRDRELHRMQDELMGSTRLAAVGELAGLTAHEVLNPITSIQGRVTRMLAAQDETFAHNEQSFAAIVEAWSAALARGGPAALAAELSTTSPMGGTLAEEDVAALGGLSDYFRAVFAAYRDDLGFLLREIHRVTHIVDGMRGLSRRRDTAAPIALAPLISESFEVLADGFHKRGISPSLFCDGDLWVEVDRYECIQVLTNLLRNAMLAIEERGGGGGSIRVRAAGDGGVARIEIEDDGVGVRPEHEPHLFEMRFTTRADGAGTGLGLCIARRLVRGWQGDLRLSWTRPGQGTCFAIELPLSTFTGDGPTL